MRFVVSIVFFLLIQVTSLEVFSQENPSRNNQTIDGYKGIWFTLGQYSEFGDKYSGGLGTYTAKHIPLSIYSPEVNKTFFVYGGTTGPEDRYLLCMIGSFDHTTHKVSKPRVVYDKLGVDDPHDNPSLAIDGEGYIWVFVSGRGRTRPGFKYRSKEPYSTEEFEQIREEEMTYPQPKYLEGKGFLHLFTKYTGVRELYFETSSDGYEWTEDQKLAGIKREEDSQSGHYQISGQDGEKIVFFSNWHPNGNVDLRTNLYYLQTTDFGTTWTTANGEVVDIPLTKVDSPALIADYFSQGKNVYLKDVNFDQNGNPLALYVVGKGHQPGPENGPREWWVAHFNGTNWEHHRVGESDQNYDSGSIFINGNEWMVVGPFINEPQKYGAGGEIVMWKSLDAGKTWELSKQLTKNSPRNHNYVRKVVKGKDPFLYFWADGNPDQLSESHLYFGNSKGKVWELPYEMNKEEAKPKRVRRSHFLFF